jgi:hypothetical protein
LGSFATLCISQTVRENVSDDDYDRIWKVKVFFLFARRELETAHKMDRTGVAESNKNAMRFDPRGDVSSDLLVLCRQYILCLFTGRVRGCNTFGLCRSYPNHIALNLSFATSERLCDVTRHPALQ